MNDKKINSNINGIKNILCLFCFICALITAFINPFKSIAFTLLTTLIALGNAQININKE
jgi:hypothetical protein